MSTTDYPDWGAPQALQGWPVGTGVPMTRATNPLGSATGTNLPAQAPVSLLIQAPVTQPGYEAVFFLNLPAAAGTVPFCTMTLAWFDATLGNNADTETFILTSGNGPANALPFYLAGPCRGNLLSVTITNGDPVNAATLTWVINQTSHVYATDRLRQPLYASTAPVGFINPAGLPATGVLLTTKPTLAALASAQRLMAACSGRAIIGIDNGAQANAVNVSLQDPGSLYSSLASQMFALINVAAGLRTVAEVTLPNGPVLFIITNTGSTGSITPAVSVIRAEY